MRQVPSEIRPSLPSLRLAAVVTMLGLLALGAGPAFAQGEGVMGPNFSKGFSPATIGPGSESTLTFTIDNSAFGTPVTDLAFTDTLPAGLTIATPANVVTDCPAGTISAPDGGSTIDLTGGSLGAFQTCTISVDVTATAVGVYMNVSGNLTSSAGNSGNATADLTVAANRPGFSKSFAPAVLNVGEITTLTFTIDWSLGGGNLFNVSFTDLFPPGLEVAPTPNAVNGCGTGTFNAFAGATDVGYFSGFLTAGQVCSLSVDLLATAVGENVNTASLVSQNGDSGNATAAIDVNFPMAFIRKEFTDDPVPPGGSVTLEFTLTNFDREDTATGITFTDDLDATLSGLVAVGLPANDVCGAGSTLTGTGLLTLTGGTLGPEESCTFSVTLQVPGGTAAGSYPNTTSSVDYDLDGIPMTDPPATDDLIVEPIPVLTKSFIDDPAIAGGTVTMELTITNSSSTQAATNLAFSDNLNLLFPGITPAMLPAAGFCGGGSTIQAISVLGELTLFIDGASLAAGDSCTFQVVLQLPLEIAAGTYLNTTSTITGDVGGVPQVGNPASDTLLVIAAPSVTKNFAPSPTLPGSLITLDFTILNGKAAPAPVSDITFTDDLSFLAGLTAVGLPMNDVCGVGSQIDGTTLLTLTGGTLDAGESCNFSVTLQVPAGAAVGTYTNTTSNIGAMTLGETVAGPPAIAELEILALAFTKEFTDDPVVPGATVTLEFTFTNLSAMTAITGITFSDDLGDTLSGLTAIGLPVNDVCGAGSQILLIGDTIFLTGGSLAAGTSCTIPVTLQVPMGAAPGQYDNLAQANATAGATPISTSAADTLVVTDGLSITKEFTDDPAVAGGTVTLEFTITNSAGSSATGITFTDDLDATLPGLVATGLPMNNVCGAGSMIDGTNLLTLTGGDLAGATSCTFSVTLQVPAGVPFGTVAFNTTSSVTGTIGGIGVTGDPATDNLLIEFVRFTKSFDGPSTAGGNPVLTFTIENLDPMNGLSGLGFTDDLDTAIPGMVALGLPDNGICGGISQIAGTNLLTFSGGDLAPSSSCSFDVTLQVPAGVTASTYLNTTSDLVQGGLVIANPATAILGIEPPPTFAKSFAPGSVGIGIVSTLSFVIDNSASAVAADSLDFTDNLPAGLEVAAVPNVSNGCSGTVTAVAGSGTISLTGGTVAAGASCVIQVDVVATAAGDLVNTTGDLTSTSGNSGTATDTLTANPQPGLAKAFAPTAIAPGGVSTVTLTIDNTASTVAATNLDVGDTLPAALVVANPANAATTCTGGTVTAVPGAGMFSYTGGSVAAGASCTVTVDVTGSVGGIYTNTTGNLTSTLGNSGTASAEITIVDNVVTFSKAFLSNPVLRGGLVELEFTIVNGSTNLALSGITFSDDLDAALTGLAAVGLPAADVCGAGSMLTGTTVISLTGANLPASGSCTFSVMVQVPPAAPLGAVTNVTSQLDAIAGSAAGGGVATSAPPAMAGFDVAYLLFSKIFDPAVIQAGEAVVLGFMIENPDPINAATDIAFTDDLDAAVPGMMATDTPQSDVCGAGSMLTGSSLLTLTGGSLAGGASCVFSVMVQVPTSAAMGTYTNVTSPLTAVVANNPVTGDPADVAQADIEVGENAIAIPTLGTVGLTLLAALMALLALAALKRRRELGAR